MKRRVYKTGILLITLLLLLSGSLSAQPVTKEYHKEYDVDLGTTLEISNKYGDILIDKWDQDRIVIDVKVTIELPIRDKAEKLLSFIDVSFSEDKDLISAKTVIDDKFSFSGWGSRGRKFSINYTVKMPDYNNLTLSNRYGNTNLADISGNVRLDIKYGNLAAGNLSRSNEKPINSLNIAYGKASITEVQWIDVTVRYSGSFKIEKSQALLVDSKYSKLEFGEASSIVGVSKYDKIRMGNINNLVLESGYSDIEIGSLAKKLKFEGGYGALSVEEIPAGFESIETDTKYISIKLGIADNASYQVDAKLSYGSLKFDENNFKHKTLITDNNKSEISGKMGTDSSSDSFVKINSSFGTVRLTQ